MHGLTPAMSENRYTSAFRHLFATPFLNFFIYFIVEFVIDFHLSEMFSGEEGLSQKFRLFTVFEQISIICWRMIAKLPGFRISALLAVECRNINT